LAAIRLGNDPQAVLGLHIDTLQGDERFAQQWSHLHHPVVHLGLPEDTIGGGGKVDADSLALADLQWRLDP
jgi:hypothetical protein